MRINAVVLRAPGTPVAVEEVELDAPTADEVLVRVAAAGVCHSDVYLADGVLGHGRWPMVLGHEGAGVVEAVGERVTHVAPGDRVELRYWPSLFSAGLVVGAVVAVGLGAAGAIATGWRRRRVATETVKAEVAGTVPSTR